MMSTKTLGFLVLAGLILTAWFLTGISVDAENPVPEEQASFDARAPYNAAHLKGNSDRILSSAGSTDEFYRHLDLVEPGFFVFPAQDDPSGYPGPEPVDEIFNESLVVPDFDGNSENLGYPSINENNPRPSDSVPNASVPDEQNAEPAGGSAGMVYLWMAFIAAVVIFTAAILGAILLYRRQNTQG